MASLQATDHCTYRQAQHTLQLSCKSSLLETKELHSNSVGMPQYVIHSQKSGFLLRFPSSAGEAPMTCVPRSVQTNKYEIDRTVCKRGCAAISGDQLFPPFGQLAVASMFDLVQRPLHGNHAWRQATKCAPSQRRRVKNVFHSQAILKCYGGPCILPDGVKNRLQTTPHTASASPILESSMAALLSMTENWEAHRCTPRSNDQGAEVSTGKSQVALALVWTARGALARGGSL